MWRSRPVIGVNSGTKQLQRFLDCSKEYRSTGLLGCSTDSYDSKGAIVDTAPWQHVTREDVEKVLERFRGEIIQMPPMFVAPEFLCVPSFSLLFPLPLLSCG